MLTIARGSLVILYSALLGTPAHIAFYQAVRTVGPGRAAVFGETGYRLAAALGALTDAGLGALSSLIRCFTSSMNWEMSLNWR